MYCPLRAVAWTIIDSFAIPTPIPADLTAANDNDGDGAACVTQHVVIDLLPRKAGLRSMASA
jgi:hypothetical protein